MSLPINVTPQAAEDAVSIAQHLAERSGYDTSDRFLEATTQAYRQLADMPGVGSPRDYGQKAQGLRLWPVPGFRNYLIFYTATETELRVLRVIHGAQNIEQIFSDPDED